MGRILYSLKKKKNWLSLWKALPISISSSPSQYTQKHSKKKKKAHFSLRALRKTFFVNIRKMFRYFKVKN